MHRSPDAQWSQALSREHSRLREWRDTPGTDRALVYGSLYSEALQPSFCVALERVGDRRTSRIFRGVDPLMAARKARAELVGT